MTQSAQTERMKGRFALDRMKVSNPDVLRQIGEAFLALSEKSKAYPCALLLPFKEALPIVDELISHYADQAGVEGYDTHATDELEWLTDQIERYEERHDPYADRRSDYDEHSTLNAALQGIGRAT